MTVPCSFAPRSTVLVEAGSQPWGCVLLCLLRQVLKSKVSLKGKEHVLRSALATQWVATARSLAQASPVLKELIGRSDGQLTFLFSDPLAIPSNVTCRAGSAGWSSAVVDISVAEPALSQLLDFLDAVATGARSDRGRQRVSHAKGNVSAMKFAAYKLELQAWSCVLEHAAVASWLKSKRWSSTASHQVLPLPLSVARKFEQACMQCEPEDQFLIWTFLLMLWGALRWSDVQRIDFSTLVLDKVSLRGWSWRTKTSVTGMPWGVLVSGIEEPDWGQALGEQLLKMSKDFNVVSISTLSSSIWRRGAGRRFSLFFA